MRSESWFAVLWRREWRAARGREYVVANEKRFQSMCRVMEGKAIGERVFLAAVRAFLADGWVKSKGGGIGLFVHGLDQWVCRGARVVEVEDKRRREAEVAAERQRRWEEEARVRERGTIPIAEAGDWVARLKRAAGGGHGA